MLQVGQIVGSYRILRALGQGGMGAVFAAEHELIGRRAAIKVLHPSLSLDPLAAGRFLNEARTANVVEHPGLVQIYEYGALPDGSAYIVMEYLEGETLRQVLRRRVLRPEEVATVGLQIAEALAAAHARDIIHRDLKPDNAMLVRDRQSLQLLRVKVLDFGLAKLSAAPPADAPGPVPTPRTRTGMAVGTPEYMSPEQCKGLPLDGRSDCYALGALLFELLTGRMPYTAAFAFDLMRLHVHAPVPALPVSVPPPLRALVGELLAKDPAQRPSMEAVAERLRPLAGPLTVHAAATDPVLSAKIAESPTQPATPPGVLSTGAPSSLVASSVEPGRLAAHPPLRTALRAGLGLAVLGLLLSAAPHRALRPATPVTVPRAAPRSAPPALPGAPAFEVPSALPAAPAPALPVQPAPSPPAPLLLQRAKPQPSPSKPTRRDHPRRRLQQAPASPSAAGEPFKDI